MCLYSRGVSKKSSSVWGFLFYSTRYPIKYTLNISVDFHCYLLLHSVSKFTWYLTFVSFLRTVTLTTFLCFFQRFPVFWSELKTEIKKKKTIQPCPIQNINLSSEIAVKSQSLNVVYKKLQGVTSVQLNLSIVHWATLQRN